MNMPAPTAEAYPRRWAALAILLLAAFMNLVDLSIVNVALPSMQRNMDATSAQIEWVAAAYVMAFALGLLPFGRLGDRIGRKRMFLLGVGGFTLFSMLCGMAPTMTTLIAARALQGLAGAMMIPQVLALAQIMFPPEERALAFSLFGLSAGLASVTGPLAGGLLIDANLFGLDWRPIFLVNLPIGLLAILAAAMVVPATGANRDLRNDWGGMLIAGLSVFLLIFPLIEGHSYGWPSWAFVMIAAAIAGFALFFLYERWRARQNASELLPVALLGNTNFLLGSMMTIVFFSGVSGFFLVLAIFLQSGFGFTPLQSGLTTTPFPVGVLIASVVSGRLGLRWSRQRIALGALCLAAGMLILRVIVGGTGDAVDHWDLLVPLILCGFGMGVGISPMFQTVLSGVPPRDAGSGSGALQSFQQIGSAVGIAITGQIFFSTLTARFAAGSAKHPAYVVGFEGALLYEVLAFLAVAGLVLLLKAPPAGAHPGRGGARPQPQEQAVAAEI
ncbi:MFS transporter [Mesorhizobium sp. L-8-3]|uniref:MFS transporter n=1 Tax=Mesorhizobium sp. L-8-3 TaxID=2744522 RepID=UPI001934D818|nr:MFS transporter [Mesorhizobium sp. L-8-3]BCH26038.1 MFS transporter [Mesorhizobium sp. L-8-3]